MSLPQAQVSQRKALCPKRMGRLMTPCPKRRDRLKSLCPVAYALLPLARKRKAAVVNTLLHRCNKRWPDFAAMTPKRQDASVMQRLL